MLLWKIILMAERLTPPRGASEVKGVDGHLPILIYSMRRVCGQSFQSFDSFYLRLLLLSAGSHPIRDRFRAHLAHV